MRGLGGCTIYEAHLAASAVFTAYEDASIVAAVVQIHEGGRASPTAATHFSASKSHGGDGGWSPNRKSCGRSPQPHSGNEGLEGAEEATLRGLDDMANCSPQRVADERVGAGAGPTQMSGSEKQRSRPKTRFLASRGRLITKECPMCRRSSTHTCLLCNTRISLFVERDMHNKEQISVEGT